jgi:hypothetical protein
MSCDFKYLVPTIVCNINNPIKIVKIFDCNQDVISHLKSIHIYKPNFPDQNPSEIDLILTRSGLNSNVELFKQLNICNEHRYNLGILFIIFVYFLFITFYI